MIKDKLKKQKTGIEKKLDYLLEIINDTLKYWLKSKRHNLAIEFEKY